MVCGHARPDEHPLGEDHRLSYLPRGAEVHVRHQFACNASTLLICTSEQVTLRSSSGDYTITHVFMTNAHSGWRMS